MRALIVNELRGEPAHFINQAVLMAGSQMAYSAGLDTAYVASPFNPDVDLCPEETIRTLARVEKKGQIAFEFTQPPEIIGHLSRDVIAFNLLHAQNYFHFLIEYLPSLFALAKTNRVAPNAMIATGLLHANMWTALLAVIEHLSIPVIQLRKTQAVTCDRAILVTPSWHGAERISGVISDSTYNGDNIRQMREAFRPYWSAQGETGLKLYLRRTGGQRLLTNADALEQMAVAAGYRVIDAATLSFEEQIRVFSGASHIVGPTGAWLANLIFTRENTRLTVLYPVTCESGVGIWTKLGEICGVQTRAMFGPVTLYRERQPIHSDFMIPPELFAAELAA